MEVSILNSSGEVTLGRLLPNRSILPNITRCYQLNETDEIWLRAGCVRMAEFELAYSMCGHSKCNNGGTEGSVTMCNHFKCDKGGPEGRVTLCSDSKYETICNIQNFENKFFGRDRDRQIVRFWGVDLDSHCVNSEFFINVVRAAGHHPHDCTFFLRVESVRVDQRLDDKETTQMFCFKMLL